MSLRSPRKRFITESMTTQLAPAVPTTPPARVPRQIPFIIANEGCERFTFYGMRNVLTPYLATALLLHLPASERNIAATEVFHTFVIGVYFFPLLGGWLSDRWSGKYRTILWFSILYFAGQVCLAAFPRDRAGFYTGLGLIAFGSGGIKPLVASFMGDQFDARTKSLAKAVFDAFYWIINLGSFSASLIMPWLIDVVDPRVAFGVPGVLMLISIVVFYSGRHRYVMVPPDPPNPDSFLRVVRTALLATSPGRGRPGLVVAALGALLAAGALVLAVAAAIGATHALDVVPAACLALVLVLGFGGAGTAIQLDRARGVHPDDAVDGVRGVLGVLVLFALITPFWSLFDQKASTWVLQAGAMAKPSWFRPAQMQVLNPLLVMVLIPFNNLVLFPRLRRRGWQLTAVRRMTTGIALAGASWVVVAMMQVVLDHGTVFSIAWQIAPYILLTLGEVLVYGTGLEFAYSQAPPAMKGVVMSFFYLSITVGSLWVLLANAGLKQPQVTAWIATTGLGTTAFYMFFFAGFAFVAALIFGLIGRRYREVDHYRA
jgi:POT family proton-dependent oligopeptide transporter